MDTNIICLRWLPASETAWADALLQRDPEWATALLWRWEFRNALTGYIRRGTLTTKTAATICGQAESSMSRHEMDASADEVFDLVSKSTCTAYDCEFVAIAREHGLRLITADRHILREFPHIAVTISEFLES
ncbi:MAG: type II toxin-antitoxin system VapC family toxin [Chthoniobacterales bacterium]